MMNQSDIHPAKGGDMNCPECSRQALTTSRVGDDQILECPTCRGLWFAKGQLDSVKDEVLPEMGWVDLDRLKEQFDYKARPDNLLYCPQCEDTALARIEDYETKTEFR